MLLGLPDLLASFSYDVVHLTQQWARAIYEDYPTGSQLDEIRYRTSHYGRIALVRWNGASRNSVSSSARIQSVRSSQPGSRVV